MRRELEIARAETASLAELQRQAVTVQRRKLVELRSSAVVGDDAFHAAEEEIDPWELTADVRIRPSPDANALSIGENGKP